MHRYTISKRFDFSASHVLGGLPDDHPCSRLHGHNYSVEVELTADDVDDDVGFVVDYHALGRFKRWIDTHLDHRHLNDVLATNPTAENLARHLLGIAGTSVAAGLEEGGWVATDAWQVTAVRVYETPKTCAEYRVVP